jgi:hypothetical protein
MNPCSFKPDIGVHRFNKSRKQSRVSPAHYRHFSNIRREFNSLNKRQYHDYIIKIQEEVKSKPKNFFNYLKFKSVSNSLPNVMTHSGVTSSNKTGISNLFADHFRSCYVNHTETNLNIPESTNVFVDSPELSLESVYEGLTALDVSKGCGTDGIPPSILKNCADALCVPLCFLFNWSLNSSIFPSRWKSSFLTPIFKKGSKNDVSNYRGIAILSAIPKLFEKLITEWLFVQTSHLISKTQHGFFKGRSTTTNLTCFTSLVVDLIEAGFQVDAIFTDFSKAFDQIPHRTIIAKLRRLGLSERLCSWLLSYLSGRKQRVRIGDVFSDDVFVTSGVPQGSHLGPLLFILFLNDLSEVFIHCKHLIYADDVKIFMKISSNEDVARLQSDLQRLSDWCRESGLMLNVSKCKFMSFTRRKTPLLGNYLINDASLERVSSICDLGVTLDETLSFNRHIDSMVSRANGKLGFIRRCATEFHDPFALKSLYVAFVRSQLEYCSTVWSPRYNVHSSRIEGVQRKFARFALRRHVWSNNNVIPTYSSRCDKLDLQTLAQRRDIASISFIFKLLQHEIDCDELFNGLTFNENTRDLRNPEFFRLPTRRTNYGQQSPIYRLSSIFNQYAQSIDFDMSVESVKRALKSVIGNEL